MAVEWCQDGWKWIGSKPFGSARDAKLIPFIHFHLDPKLKTTAGTPAAVEIMGPLKWHQLPIPFQLIGRS
jgi:hypothetical protein